MSKTLADMTNDQAIAYTMGKVPGCAPIARRAVNQSPTMPDFPPEGREVWWQEGEGVLSPRYAEALFFRAAWVWLAKLDSGLVPIWSCELSKWIVYTPDNGDAGGGDDYRRYDNDVVALCAACLLAAGEAVP